ncbi:MAG: hypothetical protein H0X66_17105 [Verrucomicrobia bacterium]|nr:hypothetical protein [Verrucomicrobiota bacterium]
MKTNERLRRIAMVAYTLPFLFHLALSLFRGRPGDLSMSLILAAVALTPAILFFCGVRWCRYVVGAFSIIFLLLWLATPMAQHAIDRTVTFWLIWCAVLLVFILSSTMSFTRIPKGHHG